jgi:diguanylate cyclase (GGDEF)-like protein
MDMSSQRRWLTGAEIVGLATAACVGVLASGLNRWSWGPLIVIAVFSMSSELMATRIDGGSFISGSMLGIILAAVLYGPGPGSALGALVICVGWTKSREAGWQFLGNVVNGVWFPMVAALSFRALTDGAAPATAFYYLAIFGAFLVALVVNILGVVLLSRQWDGTGNAITAAAVMVKPVLAAELSSGMLTVAAAWLVIHAHLLGLVMFGAVFAIFQYLIGELLTSNRRGELLRRIATTDELTGLGNREQFRQSVEKRIAADSGNPFFVLLMDLDRFKEVNDTLGHSYGDQLLSDLGPRLQAAIGAAGQVARLGGDEFGILPGADVDGLAALETATSRLVSAVAEPFEVDELSLEVGASIGVARYPQDGGDSQALLRCADIAMYAAKEAQADVKFYAADQNNHSIRRLSLLSGIRRALAGDELVVHYQPIVDLEQGRVIGAEGLVRWDHPEHGLIAPGSFVHSVEQSGLIGPLTRRVLHTAISGCAQWRRDGREMSVSVNLSVRNLLDRDLPRDIERLLAEYDLPAAALQLEITESMIMSDPERAMATVGRLSKLGVRLSVDDFGTGYSSLANLRRLPINELKIDRSFVSPMLADESDLIIVRSTINLGHDLGLRIVAEGVEDGPTLERLAALGCDLAQGYHLSRPLAGPEFNRWLAQTPRDGAPAQKTAPGGTPLPAGWTMTTAGLVVASPAP